MGRLARLRLRLRYKPEKRGEGVSREELALLSGSRDDDRRQEKTETRDSDKPDKPESC